MKTINILIFALLVGFTANTQQVISVRSQHTKKLIRALREGEMIGRGEGRILLRFDGEDYEYLTFFNGKYQHYKNDQWLEELPFPWLGTPKKSYRYHERIDGKYMFWGKINGTKIGPYEELELDRYTDENQQVHGYYYKTDNQYYVKDRETGKTHGPYEKIRVNEISEKNLLFTFLKDGQWYLKTRSETLGPFENVKPFYGSNEKYNLAYTYLSGGIWKINCPQPVTTTFVTEPFFEFCADGQWRAYGKLSGKEGKFCIVRQDGTVTEHSHVSQQLMHDGLPAMTLRAISPSTEPTNGYGFGNSFGYLEWYEISIAGNTIGTFQVEALRGQLFGKSTSVYPLVLYQKAAAGSADRKQFYLYQNGIGLVGPIPADSRYTLTIGGNGYAYIADTDRRLYVNSVATSHTNVNMVDLAIDPEAWYMAKKEGYYLTVYRNEKPDHSGKLEEKYPYLKNSTRKAPYVVVTENNLSYVKLPASSKLYGPVNPRSIFAFSRDNTHYAEGDERAAKILIDGKVISSGYSLVHNPNKNAFHWISQEGQKLYFHTYEPD